MAEKMFTFINNGKNPVRMHDFEGAIKTVPVGGAIKLGEKGAKLALSLPGFQDLSKMAQPAGDNTAELVKEIAALKKENAELKSKLAASEKEKEDLLA